jgi:hypothetical protein
LATAGPFLLSSLDCPALAVNQKLPMLRSSKRRGANAASAAI